MPMSARPGLPRSATARKPQPSRQFPSFAQVFPSGAIRTRGCVTLTGRAILNESPNRMGSPARRLVIEATYPL